MSSVSDRVLMEVERARDEIVDFAARLIRIPTVNPPGAEYETCAAVIGDQLRAHGMDVQLLPAVGVRRKIADHFKDKVLYGGLTYNSHPLGCAAAVATIAVYEEDNLIERARKTGVVMKQMMEDLKAKHPCVGDVRSIGLFGIVELVKSKQTMEPLAPFNGSSPEMQALGKFFREEGLYTFVRWNGFFTNPPLCITEAELAEAFAIIDKGLYNVDEAIA